MFKVISIISVVIAISVAKIEPLTDTAYDCDSPEIVQTFSAIGRVDVLVVGQLRACIFLKNHTNICWI